MNVINRSLLKFALLPSAMYRNMGVNLPQLKAILHTKLTMDDRRPSSIQQARKTQSKKPVSRATVGTMVLSAVLGLIYLLFFSIGADKVTQLSFYFSMFFFMLSMSLVSDFTSVLIDVRDNFIILPKPVNDRTFIVARLLHIFIHICRLVLPMSLPGVIFMGITVNVLAGLVLLLITFFLTLFSIFFINALYILILRFTTAQKFQSIISYFQIFFAIAVYASSQLLPRMMDRLEAIHFNIASKPWAVYYPMYWFACAWKILVSFSGTTQEVIAAAMGFLLPLVSVYIVVRFLAPTFNNKLAQIGGSGGSPAPRSKTSVYVKDKKGYGESLSRLLTRGHAERMGFLFTWKMTSRSRDFKMKVYPSIGYLLVYVVLMFMRNKHMTVEEIAQQGNGGKFIIISALYFTSFLLTMALNQIVYSDKFKASWIYYVSPIKNPGEIILGGAKAAIFKFYIPIVLVIAVTGIGIVGPSIVPNIVLGLFNELLIATILVYMGHKVFPFSMHQNTSVKTGSFLRSMAIFFISLLIAGAHFFIYEITAAVLLCALLSIAATWMMMSSIRSVSWDVIKSSYTEE